MSRLRTRDDSGVALLVSLALIGIVTLLLLALVGFSLSETRQSGRERQRASAVATAEGQVNAAIALIQSSGATLPCAPPDVTTGVGADSATVKTEVRYFDKDGVQLTTCPLSKTSVAASMLVRATATPSRLAGTQTAVRTMESRVNLTPTFTNGVDKAIFGDKSLTFANNGHVNGSSANMFDGDLYTNGDFSCTGQQQYQGSVYAQGALTFSNGSSCEVYGDVWAKGNVSLGKGVVHGWAMSTTGNVVVDHNAAVQGARAGGTVTWSGCPSANCLAGWAQTSSAGPPTETFPGIEWNSADANSAPQAWPSTFAVKEPALSCVTQGRMNDAGQWLVDNAGGLTQPTLMHTQCGVVVDNPGSSPGCANKHICLANDLVIFADGGVTFGNGVWIESSTSGVSRNLWLIQPSNSTKLPANCTGPLSQPQVSLSQQTTVSPDVHVFIYTPCNLEIDNNLSNHGQLYAGGTVKITNNFDLSYKPMPVYGVKGLTQTVKAYNMDIVYIRENR